MKAVLYSGSTASAAAIWLASTAAVTARTTTPLAFTSSLHSSSSSHGILTSSPAPRSVTFVNDSCRRRSQHESLSSLSSSSSDNSSFESLGLSDDLVAVAEKMKWDVPTPVQQLSIPAIISMAEGSEDSSSLWCEGPTGSGKTGGFSLPLLQILMQQKRLQNLSYKAEGHVSTLILCPTRELAAQTGAVLQRLASHLPNANGKRDSAISIDVIHGGVPMEPQVARLARKRREGDNIDILVATPGRLVDVLKRKDDGEPTMSALERRIMDAFDEKSLAASENRGPDGKKRKRKKGQRGGPPQASSLTLSEIQDMDLDRVDDDGRASVDEMLRQLDYLVLDEADRLLGGAFKDDMDKLLSLFPNPREEGSTSKGTGVKTLLFSATFPEQIENRVDRVLSRMSVGTPLRVSATAATFQRMPSLDDDDEDEDDLNSELSNRQKKHLANTTPIKNVMVDTAPRIRHRVIRLDERDRTQALRFLLDQNFEWDRILVFVATRYSTEHITRKLKRYGIAAADLHGKLDQDARERRLKAFRSGKTRVLISTDLAARGIDVEGLPVVVHYDLPRGAADFTHRSGRTGRAGKTGTSISFVSAKSESHFDFIEQRELMHNQAEKTEREVIPQFAPNEEMWDIRSAASTISLPGATHSGRGLEHDRTFGGVKGRSKSKKDKLREAAAKKAARQAK